MKSLKSKLTNKSFLVTMLMLILAILIIFLASCAREFFESSSNSIATVIISSLEAIGLLVPLIIGIRQLFDSKEIARATFIVELNKTFVENSDYLEMYELLQKCYDGNCVKKCANKQNVEVGCNQDLAKGKISNYLTFFETIYILKKRNVVSFDVLDDLFAYRFFLAIHSKIVQQQKIKIQPDNFKNIFCLEYEWLKWREDHGEGDKSDVKSVYNTLLLKDLVGEEYYDNTIKKALGIKKVIHSPKA